MQFFVRSVLVCMAFMLSLRADRLNPDASRPARKETVVSRPKARRLRWLRRIGSAEVGLAMKLSGAGIERPAAPSQPLPAW
jgi:hypothetical protein